MLHQFGRFFIAVKLQDDRVIDNRSKTCTSLFIFLDNVTPRICGAAVCYRPLVTPPPRWLHCHHEEKGNERHCRPYDRAQRNEKEEDGEQYNFVPFHFVNPRGHLPNRS
jgi:hypothetical protein